jgi:uncharacterized protein DUF3563
MMRAANFQLEAPGSLGAWVRQAGFSKSRTAPKPVAKTAGPAPRLSLLERFDRWLWQQHVREREAYLADSKDIFELEERMRGLERAVGCRYY